ncbi:unnamed protein product [Choristocarpus tenellus]
MRISHAILGVFIAWLGFSAASPFSPHPLGSLKQAFFEGWFLRIVDHEKQISLVVIISSYRRAGADSEDLEHYCSLGYQKPPNGDEKGQRIQTWHVFREDDKGGPTIPPSPPDRISDPDFTWAADGVGSVTISGDVGQIDMVVEELSISANFSTRVPWSKDQPNNYGPEGWLGQTDLLPLRYFIHSFGSDVTYTVTPAGSLPISGRGLMHIEANYGRACFPKGWVWAEGMDSTQGLNGGTFVNGKNIEDGETKMKTGGIKFIMTGGKFIIGPITTNSFVIGYRSPLHDWDFRNTDLDCIKSSWSHAEHRLNVTASSFLGRRVIKASVQAAEGSFGDRFYMPGPEGWTNLPGATESHNATATFHLYERRLPFMKLVLVEEAVVTMSVLEFGGEFVDPSHLHGRCEVEIEPTGDLP